MRPVISDLVPLPSLLVCCIMNIKDMLQGNLLEEEDEDGGGGGIGGRELPPPPHLRPKHDSSSSFIRVQAGTNASVSPRVPVRVETVNYEYMVIRYPIMHLYPDIIWIPGYPGH